MGDSFRRDNHEVTEAHSILWTPPERIGGLTPVPREGQELALPEVGSTYWNSRGMEFLVLNHTTIDSRGKRIEPSHKPGYSLERLVTKPVKTDVPVVAARGFSNRLLQLWEEFEAVCPKPTAIVDTAFAGPAAQMRFGGHAINWLVDPRAAVLIIHSSETDEDTLAHELMHGWLDLVMGYEDHRMYRDLEDHATMFLVDTTQCMVLDCLVQEAIGARGFDPCHWTRDYVEFMYENAVGLDHGVYPVSRYEASFAARLYALPEAVPHLFRLNSEQASRFMFARNVFRDRMPDLARLGDEIVRAFREGDYHTNGDAHRLIDRCLRLTADYVGTDLDLDRDLVLWQPPEPEYMDKFPDMFPRFPVQLKYEVNRKLLRENWPVGTLIQATATRGSNVVRLRFNPPADSPKPLPASTWEWQSPQPLALPEPAPRFPDPEDLLPMARLRPRSWESLTMGNPRIGPDGRPRQTAPGPMFPPAVIQAFERAGLPLPGSPQSGRPQTGAPQPPAGPAQQIMPSRMYYVEPEIPGVGPPRPPVPGMPPPFGQPPQPGAPWPPVPGASGQPGSPGNPNSNWPHIPRPRKGRPEMRYYLPGLGRFISRVHLHEAVARGLTTYERLRNEWGINIGPLGTPEAFARNEMPEHPYTYAANNPVNYIDPSGNKWVNPNDPRWPKPPAYSIPQRICRAASCAPHVPCVQRAVQSTYAILAKYPHSKQHPHPVLVGSNGGPRDAFRHCVWACLVRKTCGKTAFDCGVVDHENDTAPWARGHWNPTYSPQDLANDYVGEAMSARPGSCENECLAALKRGDLYILPKKYWSNP